ncbi:MAG TPA: hypothetical protein GXZ35_08460 [Acholeplasmataceae bacterium]|jgi:hemolysin-activating ACP:hemolysin acyltransferase|nr:hypothetical protein [Acholeplasmataceae bacterium]
MYDSDKIIRKMLKYFSIITAIVVIIYVFYSILIVKNRKAQEKQQLAYNKYIEKNKDAIHLADNIDNIDAGNKPIEGLSTDLQTVSELITLLDTFFENINNKDFNKALSMFDQRYCKEFYITEQILKFRYSFKSPTKFVYQSHKEYADRFIARCQIYEELSLQNLNLDFKESEIPSVYVTFTVLKEEGNSKLMDKGIVSSKSNIEKYVSENKLIEITTEKIYQLSDGQWCIKCEILNLGQKDIKLKHTTNSIVICNNNTKYRHDMLEKNLSNYVLKPNISNAYTLIYKTKLNEPDNFLKWILVDEEENEMIFTPEFKLKF